MAEPQEYLGILDQEPENEQAFSALMELVTNGHTPTTAAPQIAALIEEARKKHRERGEVDLALRLIDLELGLAKDAGKRADLTYEKGKILSDELLAEDQAIACFNQVLELRPDDQAASEVLAHVGLVKMNWQKIVKKYLEEATSSTDRQLTTSLYLSVAELYGRYQAESPELEKSLRRSLEVEPRNRKAAAHLERLLRRQNREAELATLLDQRVDASATKEDRVTALLARADLERVREGGKPEQALELCKKVLGIEPGNPRALRALIDTYTNLSDWTALVQVYENAIKARPKGGEAALALQIAMIYWKKLENLDAAEEHFRKLRKNDPAQPIGLAFYREFHKSRNEASKLVLVLQAAQKAETDPARRLELAVEMAELSESSGGSAEKAIDGWKAILRMDPFHAQSRDALKRLYTRTEKWNALLELLKEEIEAIPADRPGGIDDKVARFLEVVAIYRDKLNLDVMVINTYNTILALKPDNAPALDALAAKYEQLGRWNDLVGVLTRKADAAAAAGDKAGRAALLRRIAGVWIERFGNHAQALKPLEELHALEPGDRDASARLKEIYTKRRSWRALIQLLETELPTLDPAARRTQVVEMAKLAAEKLGDLRSAIQSWNALLETDPLDAEALAALAGLYDKDKRYAALAEIYGRQRTILGTGDARAAIALLERLGALYAERLKAPALAAEAFHQILALQPGHPKATRILRDLCVESGDWAALEKLYGASGAWDDLIEVLHTASDRLPQQAEKIALLTRIAGICEGPMGQPEKAAKAYERILALTPHDAATARKLLPIYRAQEKWARLLQTYEVLLEDEPSREGKLEIFEHIRRVCEDKLGSKAVAFQWAGRAYDLVSQGPEEVKLRGELERLAAEADAWEELAELYKKRLMAAPAGDSRVALLRALARIQAQRLYAPEAARTSYEEILTSHPDDAEATGALEQIFQQASKWPELLTIYRRRAEREADPEKRKELRYKIAFIEEERVGDLEAAAATHGQILTDDPTQARALRALEKISQSRGDLRGLARSLELQLSLATDNEAKLVFEQRLGALYETDGPTHDRAKALAHFRAAFLLAPDASGPVEALERFTQGDHADRAETARLLVPVFEKNKSAGKLAVMLEILRAAEPEPQSRLALDRRLVQIYAKRVGDPLSAYEAATRVLEVAPEDEDNLRELHTLAGELSAYDDLATQLGKVLAKVPSDNKVLVKALSWQLAELLDDKLGKADEAEAYYKKVLEIDEAHAGASDALERHLRGKERYPELKALLARRQGLTLDAPARVAILYRISDLDEGVLDDDASATKSFEQVLELAPGEMRACKALERLYLGAKRHADLDQLLARELPYTTDAKDVLTLKQRRGALKAEFLNDPAGAVDLYEEVLTQNPAQEEAKKGLEGLLPKAALRLRVARLLEPVYLAARSFESLREILRVQREFATGSDAVALLSRIAELEEREIGSRQAAFVTWREALETDPSDPRPRAAIERLAADLSMWKEAAAAFEAGLAVASATDLHLRGALLAKIGEIHDARLDDKPRAQSAYKRLLEADPSNHEIARPAAAALERLYEDVKAWPELIDIHRRSLDWAEDGDTRKLRLFRVAEIQEEELKDTAAAIATYREVIEQDPEDATALGALERLFTAGSQWPELVEVLRRRVEPAKGKPRRDLLWRIAEIEENQRKDPAAAIAAYHEILDGVPDDSPALSALSRLFQTQDRASDLLEVSERRLALAPERSPEQVKLLADIATLLGERLGRKEEALERWQRVLAAGSDPALLESRGLAMLAVERLLDDEDLRLRAAEVLEPIYTAEGAHPKLLMLHELYSRHAPDVRERIGRLKKIAETRELVMGDLDGAFDAYTRAARAAIGEPDLKDIIAALDRLADAKGRDADLVALLKEIGPDVLDAELMLRIDIHIAELALFRLGDRDTAKQYYRRVLDAQPDHPAALAALERIHGEAEEWDRLYEILARRADLAKESDDEARAGYLARMAEVAETRLSRPADAAAAYEEILELSPADGAAARSLERLYAAAERWVDLAELYEKRLGFAETIDEAVTYRFRLGELWEQKLVDPDRSIENYRAVLGGSPDHKGAILALERYLDDPAVRSQAAEVLEPIYIARQDWEKLIRIYQIRLDSAADDPEQRLLLTRKIAQIYEDQLEDLESAFKWYGKVFREAPDDRSVRDQLVRLAAVNQQWTQLAQVYQSLLDDVLEDSPAMREVAKLAADLYDRRLGDIEHARACYQRVLTADPTDAATFDALEKMLVGNARWLALIEVYLDAIEATLDPERRKSLMLRAADVYETKLRDLEQAVSSLRAVLEADPDDARGGAELERIFSSQSRWHDLVELLLARLERRGGDPVQSAAIRMQLGGLYEQKLSDLDAAIDQYEQVILTDDRHAESTAALERLVVNDDHRLRIAQILEPIYRQHDEWKKLVVILDSQLPFTPSEDKQKRIDIHREIADLHEKRGKDLKLAFRSLALAWREDVSVEQNLEDLERVAGKEALWDELIRELTQGAEGLYDFELVASLWSKVALYEENRSPRPGGGLRAIDAWRKVLAVKEDEPDALLALERLLAGAERWRELVGILERRAELSNEPADKTALLARVAELQESRLNSRDAAIQAWRAILGVDDADPRALDALERLFGITEQWKELVLILGRKLELAQTPEMRRPLAFQAAKLYEERLNDAFEAIGLMKAVLDASGSDLEALSALDRLYTREKLWADAVEVLDRRVGLTTGAPDRAALRFRAAEVTERELSEVASAIGRYKDVLADDKAHGGARAALDRLMRTPEYRADAAGVLDPLYRAERAFGPLVEIQELRLVLEDDPTSRQLLLREIAELEERGRGDVGAAWGAWARALAEAPGDHDVQVELERLAQVQGSWDKLCALYEERLSATMDPDLGRTLALKLAGIYEETLGDLVKAASRYRKALESDGDERPPLAALDRIYERTQKWPDLAEILEKEAQLTQEPAEQASFMFRLGETRDRLGDETGAVHAYRDVLGMQPEHGGARAALERRLGAAGPKNLVQEVLEILEPLYEREEAWARLAELIEVRLKITTDAGDRARLCERQAEICETRLGDRVRALDAVGRALAEDPRSERLADELERLAEKLNRWEEAAARLEGIVAVAEQHHDDATAHELGLRAGRIFLTRLGDLKRAQARFDVLLAAEPEHAEALAALERIHRSNSDAPKLAEVLAKRAELEMDPAAKKQLWSEVAHVREEALDDKKGATQAWRAVLDIDEGDAQALRQLARLLEQAGRWQELAVILETQVRHAEGADADNVRRTLKTKLARIYAGPLASLDQAVEAYRDVLDLAPGDETILTALEDVHTQREDWLAVQEVLVTRLGNAPSADRKIAILGKLAQLAEKQRDSIEEAVQYWHQALEIDAHSELALAELERLLELGERWHDLIEVYTRRADLASAAGDKEGEVSALVRAAGIWEGKLENAEAATEILERILHANPRYVPALTTLARIYEGAGDWDRCLQTLSRAVELAPGGKAAADLYFRLGQVEAARSGDAKAADNYYREALKFDPGHRESLTQLEKAARERGDHAEVASILARRELETTDAKQKLALCIELADLYVNKLGQAHAAVPYLERAAQAAPEDPKVLEPLADAYFAAGRTAEATPLYERLLAALKGKRGKEVARLQFRLGAIKRKSGDLPGALANLEEAYRIDTSHIPTMAALGEIYFEQGEWEKARRIYRSLLLQNLDAASGVSKADVYLKLGLIHAKLGEGPKAKNMYERGLELEPTHAGIKQAMSQLT